MEGLESLLLQSIANGQVTSCSPVLQQGEQPITPPIPASPVSTRFALTPETVPSALFYMPPHYLSMLAPLTASAALGTPHRAGAVLRPTAATLGPPAPAKIPRTYVVTLVIDGARFIFDARHVPDPPVQHFSKDIDLLFVHWRTSTILTINGRGIPIKHWADVYKALKRTKVKPRAWDVIKVEWGNWKVSS